ISRHGNRFRHRGIRRRGDRRARLDARRARRRADRRPHLRLCHRALSRSRSARGLRDRDCGAAAAPGGPVRASGDMTPAPAVIFGLAGTAALALLPPLAPSYYATLMIPFFGYAIALLGFNLLFGYTGLLSFGHAMFLGFGAYGAAVLAGIFGIKSFEAVLFA